MSDSKHKQATASRAGPQPSEVSDDGIDLDSDCGGVVRERFQVEELLMSFPWESELPALSEFSDEDAADAIGAMTEPSSTVEVYGSWRTLMSILTPAEYSALRMTFDAEVTAGNVMLRDAGTFLEQHSDPVTNGGGIPLNHSTTVEMITGLCTSGALADVPGKVAAYCQSFQPAPCKKYSPPSPIEVHQARQS